MEIERKKIMQFIIMGLIFLIAIEGACLLFFSQTKLDNNQVLKEDNYKDFQEENGLITSLSDDPFINVYLDDKTNINSVSVFLSDVSEEGASASIHVVSHSNGLWKCEYFELHNGWNQIVFPESIQNINVDFVRLDLAEKEGVSFRIHNVILNDSMLTLKKGICLFLIVYAIVILSMLIVKGVESTAIQSCVQKIRAALREYQFLMKPTLILFLIYLLGCLSIIRANVNYLDDLARQLDGHNTDWIAYQRYLEYFLSKMFNVGDHLVDLSPLSTVIGCLVTAFAGAVLLYVITDKIEFGLMNYVSMIPLGLSPYYLECLSYKFESPYYGFAIVFSILPFLVYKKGKCIYIIVSIISLLGMFNTYYATSGVYPMVVLLLALMMWTRKEDLKKVIHFIIASIISYGTALIIYKVLIMKPVDSWVSSTIPSLDRLIPTIVSNYQNYCSCVLSEFKTIWLYMILLCAIGFVFAIIKKSDRNALISGTVGSTCLILMGLLCWGLFPALEHTSFYGRAMFGFGIYVSLIAGTVCGDKTIKCFKVPVLVLGWCFYIFSFSYGNYLYATQVYNEFRIQNVLNYLNDLDYYSDSGNEIFLQVAGDAGRAPIIEKIPADERNIINKLLTTSFNGGWSFGEMEFYEYYNLGKGYSWEYSYLSDIRLEDMNLPQIDSTMYFDVYGDKKNLLILLK